MLETLGLVSKMINVSSAMLELEYWINLMLDASYMIKYDVLYPKTFHCFDVSLLLDSVCSICATCVL